MILNRRNIYLILSLLLYLPVAYFQQNIMKINGGEVLGNDTLEVKINIENDQRFISFQCDVILPEQMEYVTESAVLTTRARDHVLNANQIQNNTIRLFSYSLNNKAFSGDSGSVATFQILSGDLDGTFELILQNAIIGDSLSQNIITDSISGKIIVSETGIPESVVTNTLAFSVSPNPFHEALTIDIDLKENLYLSADFTGINGNILMTKSLGYYSRGHHAIQLKNISSELTGCRGFMFLRLKGLTKDQIYYSGIKKILK